ncbi:MAG TPA: hypothetical protein VNZ52_04330 [Candidatus Thermoplasmatota archaeon]|nr:hypothetical protein [Candidatus Thermoplasmatota archaeon]
MTEEISLTLGSRYRILSLGSRDEMIESVGTFKGIVSVGTVDGVALELTDGPFKGKVRVIPSHVVLAIDILEAAKKEEEAEDEVHMHYG